MFTFIKKFLANKNSIGNIKVVWQKESSNESYWKNYPPENGRIKGYLVELENEIFVIDNSTKKIYRAFNEYEEWAKGMMVEASVQPDPEIETTINGYLLAGWAYQIYVRSIANGDLYALPDPDKISKFTGKCRCPMCMGKLITLGSPTQKK